MFTPIIITLGENNMHNNTKKLVMVALFVTLIIIGSFIKIPTPLVPITLQLAFCLLAGILLGGHLGASSVIIYVAMGLLGLPVFAYGGGFSYILKPTFGYNLGFILGVFVVGIISRGVNGKKQPTFKRNLFASLIGIVIVYSIGVAYMYFILNFYLDSFMSINKAITYGCLMFLPTDIFWCVIVSYLGYRLAPLLQRSFNQ